MNSHLYGEMLCLFCTLFQVRFADSEEEKRKRREDRTTQQTQEGMMGMSAGQINPHQMGMQQQGMHMGMQQQGMNLTHTPPQANMQQQQGLVPGMMSLGMQVPMGVPNLMGRFPIYSPVMSQ